MRCPKSTLDGRYGEVFPDLIAFVCKTGHFFFGGLAWVAGRRQLLGWVMEQRDILGEM